MSKPTVRPSGSSNRSAEGPAPETSESRPRNNAAAEPPHDNDAERAVLGACMRDDAAVDTVRVIVDPGDFYRAPHETIWRAILALRAERAPTDPVALVDHLRGTDDLTRVGGTAYVHSLVTVHPLAGENVAHHAGIIRREAALRALAATGILTAQRAQAPGADPDLIRTAVEADIRAERERAVASGTSRLARYIVNGWDFVTKTGAPKEPLWGTPEKTAWADGESLMTVGAPGVGKTTIAHQVVLARLGSTSTALGMPVAEGGRILYLAMDRPKQIARALARGVTVADETRLRERLVVWQGPLPSTLDREPDLLAELAAAHGADTIIVDSLKDAVSTLVDDSLAVAYNNARSRALREGVQIMELHHQRKASAEAPRGARPTLDRVYGSTWLTSGAGSVLFITGEAGDPAVTIHHLKTPTGEIGPLDVLHDHTRGTTRVEDTLDPLTLLRAAGDGLTVKDLAAALTGEKKPTTAAIEKARRGLKELVDGGLAVEESGMAGGRGGGKATRYRHATHDLLEGLRRGSSAAAHQQVSAPPEQATIPVAPEPEPGASARNPVAAAAMARSSSYRSPPSTEPGGEDRSRDRSHGTLAGNAAQPVHTPHADRRNRR